MKNLFRSSKGYRWFPDADVVNAPEGALLRADNLVPDPEAQLALRQGSRKVYSGMQNRVHSLYTSVLEDKLFRFAGCDDRLYRNGEDFGEVFDGQGDLAVGDDAYQVFFARGTTKKKFDGKNFYNWPIKAPEFPATLAAVTAITVEVASFNTAESPAFTVNEGTGAFVTGHDGTASGALKLTPASSSRATASKKFASDQNYLDILGALGSETDLFDIYVWLEEPREVDKITIMFGLDTGADPYKNNYYYFDFPVKDAGTVDIKDAGSSAAAAYSIYANRVQSVLSPSEITDIKSPDKVTTILKRLGRFAGSRSRERKDPQEVSPAWTHLSVTRGQFNRIGGTAGRDWKTVRGFKVVFAGMPGTTKVVQFDSAVWTGGGNRSLTGRFRLGYRFVRNFAGKYYELSPISPISAYIDLTQQALQVTIPAQALAGKDPQVNQVWVYLIGGFLDTYYRFAVVSAVVQQGMTIDELTNPVGSNFQTKTERTRLSTWGFTKITEGDAVVADLIFTIRMSELEALTENEVIEPGSVGPPDSIVAIAGPFNSRMFVLTEEGRLYPSSQDTPSSFSLYHHLDLRRYGDPLWAVLTSSGVYVGMTKDIIRVAGTGDESEDRVTVDLYPEPLHVGNPPVDLAVVSDGNAVVYRSADGPMMLTGTSLTPVPPAGTSLLWRGQQRHGVEALNIVDGRFRFAIDNHILFMMAPEGTTYTSFIGGVGDVSWDSLVGLTISSTGVLTKTAATGATATAIATRTLKSSEGYVETVVREITLQVIGLSRVYSGGIFDNIDFCLRAKADGFIVVREDGVEVPEVSAQYLVGDTIRVEVAGGKVYYKLNGTPFYTSKSQLTYPLVIDIGLDSQNATMGPVTISGNWTLVKDGTSAIWRFSLIKQQWSRTFYPVKFTSLFRDIRGAMTGGTESDGELWELETGVQDDRADIPISLLTPIDDGGSPLSRKDVLDLQIHTDTGGGEGTAYFFLDGASAAVGSVIFSSLQSAVYRASALFIGVMLKAQLKITGSFSKFLLHAFNLTYRDRVQQVMVLDTGTIQPQGAHQMVWLTEAEIDCISPVDLEVDLYLDDLLYTTQPVVVKPGRRSSYRIPFPRSSKARAPRLVFRTTNPNGSSNPGFEAYRVRVKDRGTGTGTENEFRAIWPVGQAE